MSNGLLIPTDGPARPIAIPSKDALAVLQEALGGYIEALPFPGRDDVTAYINEEGKLLEPVEPNPHATALLCAALFAGDYIAGPCVIVGFDPHSGENTDLPGAPESLAKRLSLPEPERVLPYARAIEWQWLLSERRIEDLGQDWTERRLAALTCTYERGQGLRANLHLREIATCAEGTRVREKLRLGARPTLLCGEPLRRFSASHLALFADGALGELISIYPEGEPEITRHFAVASGAALCA